MTQKEAAPGWARSAGADADAEVTEANAAIERLVKS